ncbi:hypothetical protein [Actinomadura chokoriensis]|uniref:Uncharacterized protein n=1 Tax=Actinomadura chokoriensis TaxID=454156 RepID=A0ABV4R023_9ACTN
MVQLTGLSVTGKVTFAALLTAGVAFVVLEAAGLTDTPPIPPGLVAIVLAACLLALAPGRWTPVAGAVAALFNLVVMFAVGAQERLVEPKSALDLVAGWVLVVALVVASVGGTAAGFRRNGPAPVVGDPGGEDRD